jgi:flavin-dependent dehydrogenase
VPEVESVPIPPSTDIVVAGGGPAGATIARLLAGFGYQVALLEKHHFPRYQIGESLTPSILPLLDFLGVRAAVEAAGFLRMVGHTVCWGSAQPRTSYYSADHSRRGFQAWREDFDSVLLEHARTGGAHIVEGQAVDSVKVNGPRGVTVHCASQGRIEASFFVDASGHTGVLARQGLRQRDPVFQTLALTGYWQGASGPEGIDFANTLLETYADGLVWSVPLHNGLRNVTFLVDWQLGAHIRQAGLEQFYLAELRKIPYISGFLKSAHLAWPPRAFDASWYTAATFASERFLLVGDAGIFIDPLSSEGVHKAMASAITGAAVINTILRRPSMVPHAIRFYDEAQRTTYETHYQQSAQYYREENRWLDRPFWQRRVQMQRAKGKEQRARLEEPGIRNPQPISQVRLAPGVTIELRPVIEGPYVELRAAVIAPPYPRGVRFLQGVCVPTLLEIVKAHGAVAAIMTTYLQTPEGTGCPPELLRQVLARLYQEGVLTASEPDENQSS